jgi:N-acetylneuraminic acid mutarotase
MGMDMSGTELSRRRFLEVAGISAGAAMIPMGSNAEQATAHTMQHEDGAMPTAEEMQSVQRAGLYVSLRDPKVATLPMDVFAQRSYYTPAPPATSQGRWTEAPLLPLPRSEMAWATEWNDRMHIVGGYGEGKVDRPYHHIFDPKKNAWSNAAPVPRGSNHIGVAALNGVVYAFGGFVEQNRIAIPDCYAYDVVSDRWSTVRPLQIGSRGAVSLVTLGNRIHCIGGRDTRSVDWHQVYNPKDDSWTTLAPIPGPRDHTAAVVLNGTIHVAGGRMDTYDFNTGMHVMYDAKADKWEERAPMPTPRSSHGGVIYRGNFFCIGGEGTRRVHAQNEAYDPAADSWQSYVPMKTPRHGMGTAVVGDAIHIAGGGPMNGGAFQSSVHEAFSL